MYLLAARSARAVQENLQKLQQDREGLQHVVEETLVEVASKGTFTTLSTHLSHRHQEKLNMEHAILRCECVGVERREGRGGGGRGEGGGRIYMSFSWT